MTSTWLAHEIASVPELIARQAGLLCSIGRLLQIWLVAGRAMAAINRKMHQHLGQRAAQRRPAEVAVFALIEGADAGFERS